MALPIHNPAEFYTKPMPKPGRFRLWALYQTLRLPYSAQRVALRLLGY